MNQGVEILLARMDSNPEEFVGEDTDKWSWVTRGIYDRVLHGEASILPFLSDEEIKALWDKFNVLRRDSFTHRVMETLLEDGQELSSSFYPKLKIVKELAPGLDALFGTEYEKYVKTVERDAMKVKTKGRYK